MVRRSSPQDPPPLGVDLVELDRAKDFWRAHRSRLEDFFSEDEIAFVKRSRRRHERLAVLLAAKEAAFKATGGAWMGPDGFRSVRVVPSTDGKLSCRTAAPLPVRELTLSYLVRRHFVVARCAGIS